MAKTSSESLASAASNLKGGDDISCQKTPCAAVGGVSQLTLQRLWLFTPLIKGPAVPGSVFWFPSVSGISSPGARQPMNQPPPLAPPVRSLPIIFDTWPPAVASQLYQSGPETCWIVLPIKGGA